MIAATALRWARRLGRSRVGWALGRTALATPIGVVAAIGLLTVVSGVRRLKATSRIMTVLGGRWGQGQFLLISRALFRVLRADALGEIYWTALANMRSPPDAHRALLNVDSSRLGPSARPVLGIALARTAFETARYAAAMCEYDKVALCQPEVLRCDMSGLLAAHVAGLFLQPEKSLGYLAHYYELLPPALAFEAPALRPTDGSVERLSREIVEHALRPLVPALLLEQIGVEHRPRIGIFFTASVQALGHAILDPYHFLALRARQYDHVFFIGPPRESYRPGAAAALSIVEQYGSYIETDEDLLLNLSWMSLGTFGAGQVELVVEHYWSLLREAVRRDRDPYDPFRHNAWRMVLPDRFSALGEAFAKAHGIDLDRPIVVLHARHSRYHGIAKQAHRDANIEGYLPAIRHLLDAGYQVIRFGDDAIPKLDVGHASYFELPFLAGYVNELDPFFISRAAFMIGCQSGPCAYARALGRKLLSVNAVLSYTLLPAPMEMACFKRYLRREDGQIRELTLEKAVEARVFLFDNSHQFEDASIEVEDARPDEILAAVQDMIAWIEDPALPETDAQHRFRAAVAAQAAMLADGDGNPELPIADYLGISLPGYRVSPTVAAMRDRPNRDDRPALPLEATG